MLIAPSEQTAPVCRPGSTELSSTCFGLLLVRKTLLNELQEQYVCHCHAQYRAPVDDE